MREPVNVKFFDISEIGEDFIVLTDAIMGVRITFADRGGDNPELTLSTTKGLEAAFFKHVKDKIGLQQPILPVRNVQTYQIFIDFWVNDFGMVRAVPFPFSVSKIEIAAIKQAAVGERFTQCGKVLFCEFFVHCSGGELSTISDDYRYITH